MRLILLKGRLPELLRLEAEEIMTLQTDRGKELRDGSQPWDRQARSWLVSQKLLTIEQIYYFLAGNLLTLFIFLRIGLADTEKPLTTRVKTHVFRED